MVLNDSVKWWIKMVSQVIIWTIIILALYFAYSKQHDDAVKLKEYKDGIQNHLVWDIKGACFFVRPHTDVTTYLIRVSDCDRK